MRTASVVVIASAAFLAGCTTGTADDPGPTAASATPAATATSAMTTASTSTGTTTPAPATTPVTSARPAPVVVPPPPRPTVIGDCPYLSSDDVAQLNGERVGGVLLDPAFEPPACAFTRGDGSEQLRVWVLRAGSAEVATATVDRAAPVDSTDPADQPAGWLGGSGSGPDGAVYAVSKGPVAVVVTTNQAQSIKARRVTELVVSSLGL